MRELLEELRAEGVTEEELNTAKASFIDVFPRRFESAEDIADVFVAEELDGRPHEYWETYRERIGAVQAKDVQRVAKKYLNPDELVFLIVGNWEEIEPGDADGRASMKEFFDGKATEIPLRDPLTLEPMTN